jgi:hypothetical protein
MQLPWRASMIYVKHIKKGKKVDSSNKNYSTNCCDFLKTRYCTCGISLIVISRTYNGRIGFRTIRIQKSSNPATPYNKSVARTSRHLTSFRRCQKVLEAVSRLWSLFLSAARNWDDGDDFKDSLRLSLWTLACSCWASEDDWRSSLPSEADLFMMNAE